MWPLPAKDKNKDAPGGTNHGTGIVADHYGNFGCLRRNVGNGHTEHHATGVVEGQKIGARIARFHGHHGFLRRHHLMENGEPVHRARRRQLRRADQHGWRLRTIGVDDK